MNRIIVTNQFAMNLGYARRLVADLEADQMCKQPAAATNHAAWVLGHLAETCDFAAKLLGEEPALAESWADLFGWNTKPCDDASIYPDKQTLLAALTEGHELVVHALERTPDELLDGKSPFEEALDDMPTLGDLLTYIMTTHEGIHLGQLSAWRRVCGLPAV